MKEFQCLLGTMLLLFGSAFAEIAEVAPTATPEPFRHIDCPLIDDQQHPVLLPVPNDCAKYYSCLNGYAHTLTCPNQLHWSPLTYRCDYVEIAKCTVQPTTTMTETPTTPIPTTALVPEPFTYHAYAGNCNRFYQCQPMHCPVNLHWNLRLQRCDWPHAAECQQPFTPPPTSPTTATTAATTVAPPTTPTTIATITTVLPPTANTPPATSAGTTVNITPITGGATTAIDALDQLCLNTTEEYLKYPEDCHKFIQCNGIAFVHKCPANLYWNSQLKVCDFYCV